MGFFEITGDAYLDLMRQRLTGDLPELTWLQQVRDVLTPDLTAGASILDVGCGTGYAYRSFERFGVSYCGIDIEERFLAIARDWFRDNPAVSFGQHDITRAPSPVSADVVICSATLEHAPALMPSLEHLAQAAGKVLVLRTFLGEDEELVRLPSPVPEFRDTMFKHSNQYAFGDVLRALHDLGFTIRVQPDRYTQSMPELVDGLVRRFYVVVARRPADPKANDPRRVTARETAHG